MKLYTPQNMRDADKYTIESLGVPGIVLMDRAAEALFLSLGDKIGRGNRFVILCGKGNNGGDGWALAYKLWAVSEKVVCISLFGKPTTGDAMHFYEKCVNEATLYTPVEIIDASDDISKAEDAVKSAGIIVDAIFGTGFAGSIDKDSTAGRLIDLANKKDAFRLSADIPSGADAQSGRCSDVVFRADMTVTFAKGKVGMYSYPAREFCGEISVADIGIPEDVFDLFGSKYELTDDEAIVKYLPKRDANSNKGSFGRLLVYAGSEDMTGAAHLALCGALRCGAGLVAFASEPYVTDVLKHRLSEPIFFPVEGGDAETDRLIEFSKRCNAILIGCGLGTGEGVKERVERLIRECDCPIILDADGINAVSDNINIITEAKKGILLTPHPLEFSRISGLSLSGILGNRIESAVEFSEKYGCTLLLKGANTVICGKGERVCINPVACSALAKGGSGDVLAGMIAAFTAQGANLYESAVVGAYLHGKAGERLAIEFSEYGVLPSDIPMTAARILSDILR